MDPLEQALERLASKEVMVLTEELDKLCRISLSSSGTVVLDSSDHLRSPPNSFWSLCRSCVNSWGVVESLALGTEEFTPPIAFFVGTVIGDLAVRTASYGGSLVEGTGLLRRTVLKEWKAVDAFGRYWLWFCCKRWLLDQVIHQSPNIYFQNEKLQPQIEPLMMVCFLLLTYLALQCVLVIVQDFLQLRHLLRCSLCRRVSLCHCVDCIHVYIQKRILIFLYFSRIYSFTYVSNLYVWYVWFVWFVWYGMYGIHGMYGM